MKRAQATLSTEDIVRFKTGLLLLLAILFLSGLGIQSVAAQPVAAQQAVVHAVLFFSPSCPHCQDVMEKYLPPITQKYGSKLDIVGIDVTQEAGVKLYQAAVTQFKIPDDRIGVPTLIVGDTVLVGSDEIPNQLPGLVDSGLAAGGVPFPNIPGLQEVLVSQPQTPAEQTASEQTLTQGQPGPGGPIFLVKFNQNPVGNAVAVIVLVGLVVTLVIAGVSFARGGESKALQWPKLTVPVLAVIGLGIASYLAYVEIAKANTICGPGFGCDQVQTSSYATLFGILPVGVLGALGYIAILAAWLAAEYDPQSHAGPQSYAKFFILSMWGMAWFGVLFSVYLTFLEPFVIGASCIWCLGSAVVMALLLLATTEPAKQALKFEYEEDEEEEKEDEESHEVKAL